MGDIWTQLSPTQKRVKAQTVLLVNLLPPVGKRGVDQLLTAPPPTHLWSLLFHCIYEVRLVVLEAAHNSVNCGGGHTHLRRHTARVQEMLLSFIMQLSDLL